MTAVCLCGILMMMAGLACTGWPCPSFPIGSAVGCRLASLAPFGGAPLNKRKKYRQQKGLRGFV